MTKENKKRVSINGKVHKKIKKIAANTNQTVDDVVSEILEKNKRRYPKRQSS